MAVNAGSIYSEVRIALDKLSGDISKVDSSVKVMGTKLDTQTKTTATAMETNMKKGFQGINLAGVAAFAGIGIAIKGAVSLFAGFEQAMANVASVAGATDEEFRMLEEAAMSAGESTRFTASQAADALYYLASAGLSATQSTEALNAVLLLAGSTGSDLAFTSETMASALSMYNLEAREAERVSNVFAATIASSQATMEKLAVSFRYVGPVASAFGMSIEQTSAALAILYNNGFEASQAGTALRSALADLANASSPANARLQELGVSFEEINPQTNSFSEIVDVLSTKVTDASDVMAIFGDRAGPALIKLLEAGKAELDLYTEKVTGTNKAAEAYATQNDTLAGSFDRLKSAAESAAIKTADELAPSLRAVVDFVTMLVRGFNSLPGGVKAVIGLFITLTGVLTGVSVVLPALIAGFGALGAAAGPIFIAIGAVSLLAGAVIGLTGAFAKAETDKIVSRYGDLAKQFNLTEKELVKLVKAAKSVKMPVEEFAKLREETGLTVKELKDFVSVANEMGASAEELTKVGKAFGLSSNDIQSINGRLLEQTHLLSAGYTESGEIIQNISSDLGLSRDQVARILLLNEDINDELKAQAQKIVSNHNAIMKAYEDEFVRYTYIEAAKAGKGYLYQKQQAELAAAALKTATDDARVAQQIADLEEARLKKLKDLQIIQTKLDKGFIDQEEAEKQRVKVYETLANSILTINNGVDEGNAELAEALKWLTDHGIAYDTNIDKVNNWNDKLKQLNETNAERIEREREAALVGTEGNQDLIDSINAYYDALKKKDAQDEFIKNLKETASTVKSVYDDLAGAIGAIFKSINEARLKENEEQLQSALEAAGVAEDTKLESLQKQLEEAKAAGDEETQAELEQEIKRQQIIEEYERKAAQIKYEAAQAEWYNKWITGIADTASAVVEALPNVPLSISAGIAGAVQTGIILANPPKPPSFATGGLVIPSGGSAGTLVNVAENGSPELMLNGGASGEAFLNDFAQRIATIISGSNKTLYGILKMDRDMKSFIFETIEQGSRNTEFTMDKRVLK